MYEAHFGLKKPLFPTGIAQESAVFFAARHREIAASIKLALTTSDSAIALAGPAGVGKTALTATALRTTNTKLALGWITVAPANAGELLELLLVEFGFSAHRVGRVERMQMWRQFLNEMSATSSRVYVIAERAEELGADVLRVLDSLTAADPNGSLGANLVLLGQPALLDVLKAPTLASLCQRIRLRQQLQPLTLDELRAYLEHHAAAVGGDLDKLFARDALAALHEIAGGIPRLVNNVGETALTLAATRKAAPVTAQLLHEVAQMFGIAPAPASAVQPAREVVPAPVAPSVAVAATVTAPTTAPSAATAHAAGPAEQSIAARPVAASAPAFAAQPSAVRPIPATPVVPPAPSVAPSPLVAVRPAATLAMPTSAPLPPAAAPAMPASAAPPPARPARSPQPAGESSPASTTSAGPRPASTPVATAPRAPAPQPVPPRAYPASAAPPVLARAQPPPAPPRAAPGSLGSAVGASATTPPRTAARERQLMSDEEIDSFAATLTDSPDVPMLDFPVLTDAVEPARSRPRAETAYVKPPARRAPEAPRPMPLPRVVAAATTPSAPRAVKPPPPPANPAPAASEDADVLRQTQTLRAISVAKSIDDISNSMAETLFGDVDLEQLNTALEASGWTEDDAAAATPSAPSLGTTPSPMPRLPPKPPAASSTPSMPGAKAAPQMSAAKPAPPADDDPFDFLGLGHDAPLELIDEPVEPQQRKEAAHNR